MKTYTALLAENSSADPDDFQNLKCAWKELPVPTLGSDEVQIEVRYSSLNYKDALAVTGKGKILRNLPLTPGIDAAGVVRASKSSKFKEGDEVFVTGCGLGESRHGGLGEIVTAPAAWVISRPATLTLQQGMILGTAGFTAGLAVHQLEKNDLRPESGEVLVTGATGGVGSLSLLILSQKKYQTVAWTRKQTSTAWLKEVGATRVENTSAFDWKTRTLESARWAAAIDNVGGDVLHFVLARIQPHGSVASIGLAKSSELHTSVFPFILRGVNILGTSSATCPRPLREKIWQDLAALKAPWEKCLTETLKREGVIGHCHKMIEGKIQGRAIVAMKR